MRGDILIIGEHHRKAARQVFDLIAEDIRKHSGRYFITVAGESGAGKSETAAALGDVLEDAGYAVLVIQQDDFFVYPPKTNATIRVKTGGRVGPEEVRMELLDDLILAIKKDEPVITKPLVIFEEDRIVSEEIATQKYDVVIIEGTYTTMLRNIDSRVFIDRSVQDTRADRLKRNREAQDEFLEKILNTEHKIISGHKPLADIIITRDYDAVKNINDDE